MTYRFSAYGSCIINQETKEDFADRRDVTSIEETVVLHFTISKRFVSLFNLKFTLHTVYKRSTVTQNNIHFIEKLLWLMQGEDLQTKLEVRD